MTELHGVRLVERSVDVGGKTLTFSTGKYAKQASGSVVVSSGDTSVLVTAVVGTEPSRFDFLPLTVDYRDLYGASGQIPGGFLKREGRGTERETLISRLIDRLIRPMFPKLFRNEMQVIASTLSYDKDADSDVISVDLNDGVAGVPADEQIDGQRELPGATGVIDVAAFVGALKTIGYTGPVQAEPFNAVLKSLQPREAIARTVDSLKAAVGE